MCMNVCVALQKVQHHNTAGGGWQLSKYLKFTSKKMPQKFFLALGTLCMGYEYFFQKFTR